MSYKSTFRAVSFATVCLNWFALVDKFTLDLNGDSKQYQNCLSSKTKRKHTYNQTSKHINICMNYTGLRIGGRHVAQPAHVTSA